MPGNKVSVRLRVIPKPVATYSPSPSGWTLPPKKTGGGSDFKKGIVIVAVLTVVLLVIGPWFAARPSYNITPTQSAPSTYQAAEVPTPSPSSTETQATEVPTPSATGREGLAKPISYGETLQGSLFIPYDVSKDTGDLGIWKFKGNKGDVINAKATVDVSQSGFSRNNILIALTAAEPNEEQFLVTAQSNPDDPNAKPYPDNGPDANKQKGLNYVGIVNYTLPQDGVYYLVVDEVNGTTGKVVYNLSLSEGNVAASQTRTPHTSEIAGFTACAYGTVPGECSENSGSIPDINIWYYTPAKTETISIRIGINPAPNYISLTGCTGGFRIIPTPLTVKQDTTNLASYPGTTETTFKVKAKQQYSITIWSESCSNGDYTLIIGK